MNTSFDTWLARLAAGGKGGSALSASDIPLATRGLKWEMPIALAGNWTTATMSGSVSASPDATSALATFSFTSGSYDAGTGFTTWTASLAAGTGEDSTGILPSDTDGDGVEYLPMMIRITPSGGSAQTLLGAAFAICGKV